MDIFEFNAARACSMAGMVLNQMEKNMQYETETGIRQGLWGLQVPKTRGSFLGVPIAKVIEWWGMQYAAYACGSMRFKKCASNSYVSCVKQAQDLELARIPDRACVARMLLRNCRDGFHCARMLDIKMGNVTAVGGWQGKGTIKAFMQSLGCRFYFGSIEVT